MLHPRFFADDDDIEEMLSSMLLDSATHIGAGVMITADNTGRTLFVRRGKGGDQAGTWAFPGGAVEPGETPQMAARREVQEEVGYDVGDAITALDRRDTGGVDFTTYGHDADVEFRPHLNDEHDAYKWVYIEDAPEPLHPGVAATLDNWDHAMRTRDESSWSEEDHPRDKDGKFAFAATTAATTDKVHAVIQGMKAKGYSGVDVSHYAPGQYGYGEHHAFEVNKVAEGEFKNQIKANGLVANKHPVRGGEDYGHFTVGEPKGTAPHEASSPAPAEHPLAKHLPSVQGKSTERVALRKQMDSAKGDELKTLQAKHNASFWKEHQALTKSGKIEKADEVAKKLDNYSKKYGISNPLKQSSVSPATKAKAAAMVEKAATEFSAKVNAPATEAHHETIDFNSLTKVGEQKGSNPGGVYEDKSKGETGDHPQYYVKSMDEAHSKNELLASKLYALAGSKTLDYVPVKPNGDTHYVATKFEKLDKDNVSKLDATERHAAQNDFATHAWLANWDSAGTGGDNQGVKNGVVKTLDVGGSLEYRAKGTPKGELFGKTVNEWDTLRTGSKNPDAVGLYGNMTKTQLQASTMKVGAIKPSDIVVTVQSVYGQGAKSNELSQKLIARQQDIVAKAKALDTPAPEPEKSFKQLAQEAAAAPKAKTKEQEDIEAVKKVSGHVPSKAETDKINAKYNLDLQPAHLGAIKAYVGSAYNGLNAELRKVKGQSLDVVRYAKVLDAALAKMPVHTGYMQRGIHTDKGFKIFKEYADHVGQVVTEQQFTSGGTQHKLWGETTLHIEAKTAANISKLNSEGGGEVILRKGTHLYIKKANDKTHEIWAEEV